MPWFSLQFQSKFLSYIRPTVFEPKKNFFYLWKLGQTQGITATGHSSLPATRVYMLRAGYHSHFFLWEGAKQLFERAGRPLYIAKWQIRRLFAT